MYNLVKFPIKTLGFFLLLMLSFSLNAQNDIKNLKTATDSNQAKDIKAIVAHFDQLYRGQTSYAKMEMQIATPHWERTLRLEVWAEGMDKTFILITSPKKEKGIATLRIKNEMWNYLPKTNKVMKIPPSMMMGSWMGSDFTNDDLVKESSMIDDYDYQFLSANEAKAETDRETFLYIQLTPKSDSPIVWGKIVVAVEEDDFIPVWQRFYDEKGRLMRILNFKDIKQFGNRRMPSVMEMIPQQKVKYRTVIKFLEADFDSPVNKKIFTLRNLRKRR